MPIIIISLLALSLGSALAAFAWYGPVDPRWQALAARLRHWQQVQALRLQSLGSSQAGDSLGWKPPVLGLLVGLALGWLTELWPLAFVGMGLGLAWPKLLESRLRAQRLQRLGEQMPALFESLSSALRSGQSLAQALASSIEDLPDPSKQLLEEALRRVRLGDEPETALAGAGTVLEQSPLRADWRMLCTAVAVVRSSGGKLPEILDQLAATVRERQRLQAQATAQIAQSKLSGWVIGCLPPALLLAMTALDPELTAPLFDTVTGWVILAAAVGLELAGLFLMKRLAELDA